MGTSLEDLRVLQEAEVIADGVWQQVARWEPFARQVVGGQLARAADSVGANIAEAFGRYHYKDKTQFLYYARGSLFETKYWLNRALKRDLIASKEAGAYASQLTDLARQLNTFIRSLKDQLGASHEQPHTVREAASEYITNYDQETGIDLFSDAELEWLEASSISNL